MDGMNKQLTARQLACKAIHEDKANVRNPSIMAKYMKQYTNLKRDKIIESINKVFVNKRDDYWDKGFNTGLDEAIKIIKQKIK